MERQSALSVATTLEIRRNELERVALVVLLKGVNVGGHRTFRPTVLAEQLRDFDAVNIGAAGTFVIRRPVTRLQLRDEVTRRLPFAAEVLICNARELAGLLAHDYFEGQPVRSDLVRFVSVLSRRPRLTPPTPMNCPARGEWQLQILAREGRYVIGVYRREMKAIGYLGAMDRLFGVPATTRSWSTLATIGRVLGEGKQDRQAKRGASGSGRA